MSYELCNFSKRLIFIRKKIIYLGTKCFEKIGAQLTLHLEKLVLSSREDLENSVVSISEELVKEK